MCFFSSLPPCRDSRTRTLACAASERAVRRLGEVLRCEDAVKTGRSNQRRGRLFWPPPVDAQRPRHGHLGQKWPRGQGKITHTQDPKQKTRWAEVVRWAAGPSERSLLHPGLHQHHHSGIAHTYRLQLSPREEHPVYTTGWSPPTTQVTLKSQHIEVNSGPMTPRPGIASIALKTPWPAFPSL